MIRAILIAGLSFTLMNPASAAPLTFNDVVDSHDNLFYTDWGHWFTSDDDAALNAAGSNPASAAQFAGSSFNFSGFNFVDIKATGSVKAHSNVWSDPNGCSSAGCVFKDGFFRDLPVYGLIGIWSSSASAIIPFGGWQDVANGLGLMFIGDSTRLTIPTGPSAYLFLAENDGAFSDNEGFFNVNFSANVPEPGTAGLMLSSVLGMMMFAKRRQRATHTNR